jgi:hypothetical protein
MQDNDKEQANKLEEEQASVLEEDAMPAGNPWPSSVHNNLDVVLGKFMTKTGPHPSTLFLIHQSWGSKYRSLVYSYVLLIGLSTTAHSADVM